MKLRLSPELTKKIPGITVAAVVIKNIRNERKSSMVTQLLRGACAQRKIEFKNEQKKKDILASLEKGHIGAVMLHEVQLLESKLRKISNNRELEMSNNLDGLCSYLSIKNLVPFFARDLDLVGNDLEIGLIKPKQGKHPEDFTFLPETRHMVLWLIDIGSMDKEDFIKLPDECIKAVQKYCQGVTDNIYILNADTPEADLNYISEKEQEYRKQVAEEEERKRLIELKKSEGLKDSEAEQLPDFLLAPVEIKKEPLIGEQILALLKGALESYLNESGHEGTETEKLLEIHVPNDHANGDFASGIAMKLAKKMEKTPLEVAEGIISRLPASELVDRAETAVPGFINIYLSQSFLLKELDRVIALKANYGRQTIGVGHKVAIDYSSPNIAKPLGVHHLLSTIIGQTLVSLLRFTGFEVAALNYPGDWGTQFGKLLYAYKTWGDESAVIKDPLNELLKLYVRFHDEAEKDPSFEDKGREEFRKLEEGDDDNLRLWGWMKELSIKEMERLYGILGVRFDEYLGEYMYLEPAKKIIQEGIEKGIVTEGENGAMVVKFEEDKYPPYILQKGDGTTIYATRDLASIKDRIERLKADILLYVVDVAQSLHFKQLFETANKFGYTEPEYKHVVFGRMQLPEGRMSTRKGEVILMDEVIKEAVSRSLALVAEKSGSLPLSEKEKIAQEMAISAIKYNIISQNRETNITFDWDRMLSLDGNSAPYLEYCYARANSIMRKSAGETAVTDEKNDKGRSSVKNEFQTDLFTMTESKAAESSAIGIANAGEIADIKPSLVEDPDTKPYSHPVEQALLHHLVSFPGSIVSSARDYKPNHLCTYLFDLARCFNAFYNELSVLTAGSPALKESRLKLVEATAQILKNGLTVLGISVFERM